MKSLKCVSLIVINSILFSSGVFALPSEIMETPKFVYADPELTIHKTEMKEMRTTPSEKLIMMGALLTSLTGIGLIGGACPDGPNDSHCNKPLRNIGICLALGPLVAGVGSLIVYRTVNKIRAHCCPTLDAHKEKALNIV